MTQSDDPRIQRILSAVREGAPGQRSIVAIAGPPGAGKSTLAAQLVDALNADASGVAVVLGMDAYHFDDRVLADRGEQDRKGAPYTFDVAGLAVMLARLRENKEEAVVAPVFDRSLEIARAGALVIPRETPVVLVEGNYLLMRATPWSSLRRFFDLTVWIDAAEETLRERLLQRWLDAGFDAEAAAAKVDANDLPNARVATATSGPADVTVPA